LDFDALILIGVSPSKQNLHTTWFGRKALQSIHKNHRFATNTLKMPLFSPLQRLIDLRKRNSSCRPRTLDRPWDAMMMPYEAAWHAVMTPALFAVPRFLQELFELGLSFA
jgi:hypothetical protein